MRRSEINQLVRDALACFQAHAWALPPEPRWDVTDFGLGDWRRFGLVLVNLAEEPEYCEKIMYAKAGMTTPAHCHRRKKEDIICRAGLLRVHVWSGAPGQAEDGATGKRPFQIRVNGRPCDVMPGDVLELPAGWRVTLVPGVYHEFVPASADCIIGEISTANDDQHDNFFVNPEVGRFPGIEEDAPSPVRLVGDGPR